MGEQTTNKNKERKHGIIVAGAGRNTKHGRVKMHVCVGEEGFAIQVGWSGKTSLKMVAFE